MPDDPVLDTDLERRLRSVLEAAAVPADGTGVTASVARRVAHHRRRTRFTVAIVGAVVVGGIAAASLWSIGGVRRPDRVSATAPAASAATAPSHRSGAAGSDGPSLGSQPPAVGLHSGAAPMPAPCPTDATAPSMATGRYCGPQPPAGNGLGPQGSCTGRESAPPCGQGVIPNRYYAYTMPGSCSGLVIFDGRRWVSELPPPTPVAAFAVWMRLSADGSLGWISPRGAVGFQPYTGQPLYACRGSTTSAPGS
jgi:hypothetical protein